MSETKGKEFWDQARYPVKKPLLTTGRVNKRQLCAFFDKCEKELLSATSCALLKQAKAEGKDINKICVKWQHEIFESLGIHRDFGVKTLQNIRINFPSDASMPHRLTKFARICQCAVMKAMMPLSRAGDKPRRFKARKKLVDKGIMSKVDIMRFFNECSEMLRTPETAALLREAKARGEDLQLLAIRWQREFIESLGYDQECGVNSMMLIPLYYGQDRRVMMEMQLFQQTCQRIVQQATVPTMVANPDISKRRYPPKKGSLQSSHTLSRSQFLRYFKMCQKELLSEDTIKMLKEAKAKGQNIGLLSVQWQREIFEHIGVHQDWGVECLNRIAFTHAKDKEVMQNMMKFTKLCADVVKRADPVGAKKALDAQKKKMEIMMAQRGIRPPPKANGNVVRGRVLGPASNKINKPKDKKEKSPSEKKSVSRKNHKKGKNTQKKPKKNNPKGMSEEDVALMMMMMAMEDDKKKTKKNPTTTKS
ncbi:hypothetical protein AAMO2058_001673800 [Amorphochlora amoebiformis]